MLKKTKKPHRKLAPVAKENYTHSDIPCSSYLCSKCKQVDPVLSTDPSVLENIGPHYLIVDSNVLLHHMAFLEHPALKDIIIPQTVKQEVSNQSTSVFKRLQALLENKDRRCFVFPNEHFSETFVLKNEQESDNDRNDRAIRTLAVWYQTHLNQVSIVLVTDDKGCQEKAQAEGILVFAVAEYARKFTDSPELVDLVYGDEDFGKKREKFDYTPHFTQTQISEYIKLGRATQGSLNISTYNSLEGYIQGESEKIYISGWANLNRAVHGDVVAVQILPQEFWISSHDHQIQEDQEEQPNSFQGDLVSGKVIGIVKRNWRPYCGSLERSTVLESLPIGAIQNVLFRPSDFKIPRIRLRTRQAMELIGKRIVVTIDLWDEKSKFPSGHCVRSIGEVLDKQTETEVILLEHQIAHESFSKNVLRELPEEKWTIPESEFKLRQDFRNLDVCSIDPPGCTDIDDALHCRFLESGNIEVGVHIADVGYFVQPNSMTDKEAASRGTTVYLVDKRIDMLPELLGSNLCSLKSNVDRLAFSCIWILNQNGEVLNFEYKKSVIRSRASFTYEEAQNRIDDQRNQDSLTLGIRTLNIIAKMLRQRRFDCGALELASPEIRFKLQDYDPVDVEQKNLKETNFLVEEFMLLANTSVAKVIFEKYPTSALLRRHEPPAQESFSDLKSSLLKFNYNLITDDSKSLSLSLNQIVDPNEPYFNTLVRILTTRCMTQAQYFCSGNETDFLHYGLAEKIYTHFTSPIRRYSDIIVHRMLQDLEYQKDEIHKLCDNLNYRHRMAQHASRSSVELYTNFYFSRKTRQSEIEPAFVCKILKNGIIALIPKYGIEKNIKLGSEWVYDALQNCHWMDTQSLYLFSKIFVKIFTVEQGEGQKLFVELCIEPMSFKKAKRE